MVDFTGSGPQNEFVILQFNFLGIKVGKIFGYLNFSSNRAFKTKNWLLQFHLNSFILHILCVSALPWPRNTYWEGEAWNTFSSPSGSWRLKIIIELKNNFGSSNLLSLFFVV